ncbi:MAG: hypothetical protein Q7K48_01145 [Fusobacterium sp. JB021]|nr:hypothetical protein [Fusobacterium sp. JB021]
MNYLVNHPDFTNKNLILQINLLGIKIIYNNEILKLKWGKVNILDNNNNKRTLKLKDFILTSPKLFIDNEIEKNIIPEFSPLTFLFLFPSLVLFLYGSIGIAFGTLNMFYIRNLFLITNNKFKNFLISSLICISNFFLTFLFLIILNKIINF